MFSFVCFVPFLNKIWGRNFKTLRKAYWWGYTVCYEALHKGGWGSNTIFSVTYLLNVPILLLHLSFFNQNGIIIQASFSASCFFNITYEGKMLFYDRGIVQRNKDMWFWMYHPAWKVSKYGNFSGLFFPHLEYVSVFSPNRGKYGPEKTPYLDTFHAVSKLREELR